MSQETTPTFASPLVAALETAWGAIREHHEEVPPVYIITGSGREELRRPKYGHWAASRWHGRDVSELSEVLLAGERIGDGAAAVMATLLHEAAHGLCWARGLSDTSQNGKYHNKTFRGAAQELLLLCEKGKSGYDATELTDGAAVRYEAVIAELDVALAFYRTTGVVEKDGDDKPPKKRMTRITLTCSCSEARKMLMVPNQVLLGVVHCAVCDANFVDRSGKLAEWWMEQQEAGNELKLGEGVTLEDLMEGTAPVDATLAGDEE